MGLLGIVMEQGEGGLGYRMYRNMLSDMSLMDQTHLFGIKGFLFQDSTYMEFVDKVHDGIDRERYLIERETLAYLVDMLMLIVIRTITMYYKNVAGKDQLLDVARREMQILENGISPGTFQNHMKGHTEKEENQYETYQRQEIRIPGSCHSGSIGNCRDHSHDRLRHPGKQAG